MHANAIYRRAQIHTFDAHVHPNVVFKILEFNESAA